MFIFGRRFSYVDLLLITLVTTLMYFGYFGSAVVLATVGIITSTYIEMKLFERY